MSLVELNVFMYLKQAKFAPCSITVIILHSLHVSDVYITIIIIKGQVARSKHIA